MKFSVVIPVYNRPEEIDELLESLTRQTASDFEVVVVEDGSDIPCRDVVEKYAGRLDVRYFAKANSGPGPSRNYGVRRACGEYVLILDSDCVLPEGYVAAVARELEAHPCEAFGGPDRAHESFTQVQKAIGYSMTSFFTTGGIRGGRKKLDKFYPRSFNMGVRRDVYERLGGFSAMRFGEDIDFSYRVLEHGYSARLFPSAWVWHKRRTDFDKFFKQVFNSGIARIHLEKRHPHTLRPVHLLPAAFAAGVVALVVLAAVLRLTTPATWHSVPVWAMPLLPVLLYTLLLFVDASVRNRSAVIGFLSVEAAFVQLFGYGLGFLKAWWERCVMRKGEFSAYEKTFYE